MAGSEATVLVVWETILETMTRHGSLGMGMIGFSDDDGAADDAIKRAAVDTAAAGAQRATAAGLVAQPRIVNRDDEIARRDPCRSRRFGRRSDRLGDARPRGREVADAGQRLARGPASRRPRRPGGSLPESRRAAPSLGAARPAHGRRHMNAAQGVGGLPLTPNPYRITQARKARP